MKDRIRRTTEFSQVSSGSEPEKTSIQGHEIAIGLTAPGTASHGPLTHNSQWLGFRQEPEELGGPGNRNHEWAGGALHH